MCIKARIEVRKHMVCFFEEESKRKNTNRKLIGRLRREKCVKRRELKSENTRHVLFERKASKKHKPEDDSK